MENQSRRAGTGLFYLFIAEILALLSFIPFLGIFTVFVSFIISLYAIFTLSQINHDYKSAFFATLAGLILSIINNFFAHGAFTEELLNYINMFLSFMTIFYICKATAGVLWGIDQALVKRAGLIWKLCGLCTFISIVFGLLEHIPLIGLLARIPLALVWIAQAAAGILYLVFLWQSQKVLRH